MMQDNRIEQVVWSQLLMRILIFFPFLTELVCAVLNNKNPSVITLGRLQGPMMFIQGVLLGHPFKPSSQQSEVINQVSLSLYRHEQRKWSIQHKLKWVQSNEWQRFPGSSYFFGNWVSVVLQNWFAPFSLAHLFHGIINRQQSLKPFALQNICKFHVDRKHRACILHDPVLIHIWCMVVTRSAEKENHMAA